MQVHSRPDSALRCSAFDLITALDAYDAASTQLVARWLDMELYEDFSKQLDAIRERGVSAPALTVLSLQLVIAHSELVCLMWQHSSVGVSATKMQEVQARHSHSIDALRAAAARLLRNA